MLFRWLGPILFLVLFTFPLVYGFILTLIPSFGYIPQQGFESFTLKNWWMVFEDPRFFKSIFLTFKVGVLSTLFSLIIVYWLGGVLYTSRFWAKFEKFLSFFLSVPHAAFSIGLVFLISPSGFIFRLLSQVIPDFTPAFDLITYQDPGGYSLIVGLMFKEIPFLLFVLMSRLSQVNVKGYGALSRTLGYSPYQTWSKVIWPQVYSGIRFPLFIVLSYSFASVDMSYILGPSIPPPFIILILEWFQNDNLEYQQVAATGALVLFLVLLITIFLWIVLEKFLAKIKVKQYCNGKRGSNWRISKWLGIIFIQFLATVTLLTFVVNLIWSVARRWRFPDLFPGELTMGHWLKMINPSSFSIFSNTILIALAAAILSLTLVILLLEARESKFFANRFKVINTKKKYLFNNFSNFLIYLPLLVPQVIFLLGIQIFFLYTVPDGNNFYALKVIWSHFFFVFPYTYLTMSDSYKKFDKRYIYLCKTFSKSQFPILWRVKWPMLLKPILFSLALGFSVSIMEYLSTTIMGAGRIETITTEAVNLSVGGNRRIVGVYSTLQMLLPFLIFYLTIMFNHYFSRRKFEPTSVR